MTGLIIPSQAFKPFRYPQAFDFWKRQQQTHWLYDEVPMAQDVLDFSKKLTPEEINLLTQIFRFFTQGDIEVNNAYIDHYLHVFMPNEVRMMLTAFSNIETIHQAAYAHLLETVGMPETEYAAFLEYEEMKVKQDYLQSFKADSPYEIAKTMAAFGAFTEGLQLFASFAILLNFPRFNKMKGMGQIITWSVRDECYSSDTEILTTNGWKLFSELTYEDKVAQFDQDTKEVSFIHPLKIMCYGEDTTEREMISLGYERRNHIDFLVTPNHTTLTYKNGVSEVCEAKDLTTHHRKKLPVSGFKSSGSINEFTRQDAAKVALQADGSFTPETGAKRDGSRCGYRRATFTFSKDRKIERFLSFDGVREMTPDGTKRKFTCDFDPSVTKLFSSWVNLEEITSEWAEGFMRELVHWDGHVVSDSKWYYSTTEAENADYVQAIAALCGYRTSRSIQKDGRSESYKDVHRIWFEKSNTYSLSQDVPTKTVPYTGKVWCVQSETGYLVVRRNNAVCVSGNSLHCEGMIWLFHQWIAENRQIDFAKLEKDCQQICREVVAHEDAFIDLAFQAGEVQGMTPYDIKRYIRYIGDWRLQQLKMQPIFGIKKHPIPWLTEILNGVEHANFFEQRATEYSRGASQGDWSEAFDSFDF